MPLFHHSTTAPYEIKAVWNACHRWSLFILERFEKKLYLYIFLLYERLFAHSYRRDCESHTVSALLASA